MKIGALVPARIGSKRLHKKNIKMLGGKPLICWTIDTLLESNIFSDITVSTESREVTEIVRDYYQEKDVKILNRPHGLASDNSSLRDVIYHYLEHRPNLEWLGLFMPTYPFREVHTLKESMSYILSRYPWRIESLSPDEFCTLDYFYPVENGVKNFFHEQPLYCSCTNAAYLFYNRNCVGDVWSKYGLTITERLHKIKISTKEAVDIDTEEDFEIAESIASGATIKIRHVIERTFQDFSIITPENVDLDNYLEFIGLEKLRDSSKPLLVLERPRLTLPTLRLQDGSIRRYYIGLEAQKYLENQMAQSTGNTEFYPKHYLQSRSYRFIRQHLTPGKSSIRDFDLWGIEYGFDGTVIPKERIIYIDELKKQTFYRHPYYLEKQ